MNAAAEDAAPTGIAPPITGKGNPLPRLRALCLAFPEATEKEAWGSPTFRVKEKMFAMYVNNHHGDGLLAVWCKAPLGMQESLVESDPDRYFVPAYVGHQGWVGVRLEDDRVDWAALASILREGYRMAAPKRLAALLDERA